MWLFWAHLLTVMHTAFAYNGVAIEFDPALCEFATALGEPTVEKVDIH